jgi:hypothetical protein
LTPLSEWEPGDPDPVATHPLGEPLESDSSLTPELAAGVARLPVCQHCGGYHKRACPRVRSLRFHPNGTIAAVTFWRTWSTDHVLFLDGEDDDGQGVAL